MSDTLKLTISQPGREPVSYPIEPGLYTIGSDDDCHIHLENAAVADRHAILTVAARGSWIEDLDSETGTRVDDQRVHRRHTVDPGQIIAIGPFLLCIDSPMTLEDATPPVQAARPAPIPLPTAPARPSAAPITPAALPDTAPPADEALQRRRSIKQQIHTELVERLDIKRLAASHIDHDELRKRAIGTIRTIVAEVSARLPPDTSPDALIKEICDEALGLGPLEDLLADDDITEIMVNGPDQIYCERQGKVLRCPQTFMNDDSVLAVIERIVAPLGRRIDESQPYVDARLPDGSRVNAIIHPLSLVGPCLTIRKFARTPLTIENLIAFGSWNHAIASLADVCVKLRKNIVVSGGTGSGKTTLLNVLSSFLPPEDRIVTIEDAAELRLPQEHIVRLEARPPNIEGRGAISIRDLVRNALRMRPDRIVVGECRGGEALDMLQAMNTGHDGSLTTVHANSPRDVISRLETMVLMSGMDLPVRAIREQIASAIHLVIHISRMSDGSRKITRVSEIVGLEGTQVTMQDIFEYRQTGIDAAGKVQGAFHATGAVPTFLEEIASRGLAIDHAIFDPQGSGRQAPVGRPERN